MFIRNIIKDGDYGREVNEICQYFLINQNKSIIYKVNKNNKFTFIIWVYGTSYFYFIHRIPLLVFNFSCNTSRNSIIKTRYSCLIIITTWYKTVFKVYIIQIITALCHATVIWTSLICETPSVIFVVSGNTVRVLWNKTFLCKLFGKATKYRVLM